MIEKKRDNFSNRRERSERIEGSSRSGSGERSRGYGRSGSGERSGKPYGRSQSGSYGRPAPRRQDGRPSQPKPQGPNARKIALDVLLSVHKEGAYAGLSLNERLPQDGLKPEDRRLVTNLVYGTLENQGKLDYVLDQLMEFPAREMVQQDILRMGAYQILMLDRVPDSAAVNEAVKLVKQLGMESSAGFINAVLRNLIRRKEELIWPDKEAEPLEWLSVESSTPRWLTELLVDAYGFEEAQQVLCYRETSHPMVVRPNMTRLTDKQFEELLSKKELSFTRGIAPHAWLVTGASDLAADADYRAGLFSIQGQSSILAAETVEAKAGMRILDACAAPGGKSAYLCEKMQMTGRVFAWELHEKRVELLNGVKRRLGLDNLRPTARDATVFRDDLESTLDAVLLDAPCSGTGVMAEKPDIKQRLKKEDIPSIVAAQKKLLDTVCRYVKPGGRLVYSTCSVLPEENRLQMKDFLDRHPEYQLVTLPASLPEELREKQGEYGLQLLPHRDEVEGFFIAKMRRVR